MANIQLTPEGHTKLQTELQQIEAEKLPAAKERLARARSMGDLSENSEYHAAKDELGFVDGRRREVEEILKQAIVVEKQSDEGTVSMGSTVEAQKDGEKETFHIVGEFEADITNKKLSATSPIGSAFIGHKAGDTVNIEVPAGTITYKIIAIT